MDLPELITDDVAFAADLLAHGGLVGFPTETVYGLAADATNRGAIERVFTVKGRPADHPLILHVAPQEIDALVDDGWLAPFDAVATSVSTSGPNRDLTETVDRTMQFEILTARYWPGPLTIIAPAGPRVLDVVTGGRRTVAVRVPAHPVARAILDEFGSGVVAPSANRFGRVSPTNAHHVLADLGQSLIAGTDAIVDGGDSLVGLESTIVDLATGPNPQVLRHGSIPIGELAATLGCSVLEPSGPARASGMHDAHYAPHGQVQLAENYADAAAIAARAAEDGIRLEVIDRTGDPADAARRLYRDLRRADASDVDGIVVVLPESSGIGVAVRDRLRRAAIGTSRSSRAR